MLSLAQSKKQCHSFFKSEGWNIAKNKIISPFKFKFDILTQGRQKKALYFTNDSRKVKEFIPISKMMQARTPRYDLVLCIPSNLKLQMKLMVELGEAEIELITLERKIVKFLISRKMRKKIEKERIDQIRKKLGDINVISSADARIGFKIFKINKGVLKAIEPSLKSESSYLKQILNLNLILDGINIKEIKKKYNPSENQIEKGAIFLLEWASLKSELNINNKTFSFFRKIRKLRAEEPVHLKRPRDIKALERIKKELTGKKNPDKFILWESVLQIFSLCLDYIKNGIKDYK